MVRRCQNNVTVSCRDGRFVPLDQRQLLGFLFCKIDSRQYYMKFALENCIFKTVA